MREAPFRFSAACVKSLRKHRPSTEMREKKIEGGCFTKPVDIFARRKREPPVYVRLPQSEDFVVSPRCPCRVAMKIVPGGAVAAIVICALIGLASSQAESKEQRRAKCGTLQFRCKNGDCIASDLLCDGKPNCADRSDETSEECRKPEIICPDYAFRCDYGACVDGDAPCNGVDDCIDRSDELLPRCRNKNGGNNSTSLGSCGKNEFRCINGQCIPGTALCDGKVDCTDRSDETLSQCGNIDCPAFNFRCAYGACIEENLKCNGVRNCADGSDEDAALCRGGTTQGPTDRPTRPTRRPTTIEPPRSLRPNCRVPPQPQNGRWQLHKSQCQSGEDCSPRSNVFELEPGTYLVYKCNNGYRLQDSGQVFCGPEGQWSSTPVCDEIRCKPLSTASTDADCRYNDMWASCGSPALPSTLARVTCRNSYRQDSTILSTQRENVRCNAQGQWEPEPIRCVPVCGVTITRNKPLIVNGSLPRLVDFPWHATLYRSETPSGEKQFICGASIIQSDLLITAAHCVYDEVTKTVEDPRLFAVATGNIFRDFNSKFNDPNIVKKANVKRIYINCNYLGLEGNYARDIAILHIDTPFTFSSLLMPVCLDISAYSDQTVLEVGHEGKVAGFGKTASAQSSQVLQYLTVPYVPLSECRSSSAPSDTEKFITIDKFCAGYTNGSSVCDGDSGGGLVFQTGGLWYLRGVVSVGIGVTLSGGVRSCDSHAYSLYTRVSSHIEWIQDVIIKLEMYNTFPACPNRTINRQRID